MSYLLQYLLKFSISLAVLYIFYRAVLRPLTFYQCNRFYLLCYAALSFIIPFINITPWVVKEGVHSNQLVDIIPAIGNYTVTATDKAVTSQSSFLQNITLNQWLVLLFCMGAAVMLVRIIFQYLSLRRIRSKSILLNHSDSVHLYQTTAPVSPFSFGNAIYFNSSLHNEVELQRIIQHEFVHVKQKHSVDILAGELLCIVNWFNPFAWFIRHAIRQNLEFIADNAVIANGLDKKEYQYLLLKVVGIPHYSIASNFNFSSLKKRIAMMNKMKSTKLHLTKFLFVLPLLLVLLLAFRNKMNDNAQEKTFVFTGIVYDAKTSQPLANVSIKEKYTGVSAATDANGFFKVKIPLGNDSVFKLNCDFKLAGYENADGRNLSFAPKADKEYADIIFAGMRKENNTTYNGIVVNAHYQVPVDDKNQFVPDPDYVFVQDKFNELQRETGLSNKIDALAKDSKKPIWIIDGVPYAIGTGPGGLSMRAWFDKEEIKAAGFKVWVDGKIMSMEEANAAVNRYELNSVNASSAKKSEKEYGINSNLFILKRKITDKNSSDTIPVPPAPPVPVTGTIPSVPGAPVQVTGAIAIPPVLAAPVQVTGTIPSVPAPPDRVNKRGYIITVADNNGECIVLVKDKKQKIVKAIALVEWNKNKKENETRYGQILPQPPPPPPPPVVKANLETISGKDADKEIVMHIVKDDKNVATPSTAAVTWKDGKKEFYNLNNKEEKAAFYKKYGETVKPSYPVPPSFYAKPSVTVSGVPLNTDASQPLQPNTLMYGNFNIKGIKNAASQPLIIIDGKEATADYNLNNIKGEDIKEINVLKDKSAIDVYGGKGKDGVIEIKTKNQSSEKKNDISATAYPIVSHFDYLICNGRMTANGNESFIDGSFSFANKSDMPLLVVDGNEIWGSTSFKAAKGKYRMLTLNVKQGIAKYGDKAKFGALEINKL